MPKNLYCDLTEFKRRFAGDATLDAIDQSEIEKIEEAAARRIDMFTRRSFFSEMATRILDGRGRSWQWIPDLLAEDTIKLDEDGDRTFELTLVAGTDYYLKRRGYKDEDALPATTLELDVINGQRGALLHRRRLIELVGRWGFTEETEVTGAVVDDDPYTAGTTTINVAAGGGLLLAVGQTLKIEDEQFYISAIDIDTDALTVIPAVNGTTAAEHVKSTPISRFIWVPEVREAALIIAGRMWHRREAGYANVITDLISARVETFRQTDPDAAQMLEPLIRGEAMV